jgi:hypothetical protein
VRTQDSEIGANQQVGRVARVYRNDERRIEKQADIRIQPGGAEIAGTKHTTIAACIMRRCGAGEEGADAEKPKGHPTQAELPFSGHTMMWPGWD